MSRNEYSVSKPENGVIEFSVQHPKNSFEMPVKSARSFAKAILDSTEEVEK